MVAVPVGTEQERGAYGQHHIRGANQKHVLPRIITFDGLTNSSIILVAMRGRVKKCRILFEKIINAFEDDWGSYCHDWKPFVFCAVESAVHNLERLRGKIGKKSKYDIQRKLPSRQRPRGPSP